MYGVLNNLMSKCIKKALEPNPMYDPEDVGEVHGGLGHQMNLSQMMAKLKETRKHAATKIMSYQKNKEQYPVPVLAFNVAINEVDSSVIARTDDGCVENVVLPTIEPMDIDEYEDEDEDVDLTDLPAPKPTASEIAKRILNQVPGTK